MRNAQTYHKEWETQLKRRGLAKNHIPVHRWYLRLYDPGRVKAAEAPGPNISLMRAEKPGIPFYRFLYHTVGEEYLWGDRRRMADEELSRLISNDNTHIMVLYEAGVPAGFFEILLSAADHNEVKYFALMPGFTGRGLGGYMLNQAIVYAYKQRPLPLILDTCTLDHYSALENYKKRGFEIYQEGDEEYPDPRLDGTIRPDAGQHVPFPKSE